MKEFTTAVKAVVNEDERNERIKARAEALIAEGKPEVEAFEQAEAEDDAEQGVVTFKLDGRVMKAYPPNSGQLTFLMATLGRGQTNDSRFASIINIMLASLRPDDRDYFEQRLLGLDPAVPQVQPEQVEEIIAYLVGEWFARPTASSSDSAES